MGNLITITDIQKFKPLSKNTDVVKKVDPFIKEAQEFELRPFMSDEFYLELVSQFESSPQFSNSKYADLFNVKWIISTDKKVSKIFDTFTPTVKKVEEIPGRTTFSIYEIDRKPDYFLVGSGKLTSELNKITIQNAGSNETVIKYHWLETLAVKPELPLEKYEIDKSPIGFIKVDNGDIRDFVIYNTYEFNSEDSQGVLNKIGRYLDIFHLSYGK